MLRRRFIVLFVSLLFGSSLVIHQSILSSRRAEAARTTAERADMVQEVESEVQAMFQGLEDDFSPYPTITLEMVEQAYCSTRRAGFRFQVVGGQMYVVGEVAPWQSRHEFIKHQLLELARADKQLPDVDMYFASEDIPEWTDMSEMPPRCRVRGPHIQHTKTSGDYQVILHPDETFGGWPEASIGPWAQMQQVMSLAAEQHAWRNRDPALFFSGANLGFQRRNLSFTDWSLHRKELDVRWVNWGDPGTILPLHAFCSFRHLLHMPGCSWSSRLKYLMLCKSVIVFPEDPYLEFWYPALRNGVNMVQVHDVNTTNKGEHLIETARQLQRNPRTAKRLAAAAQATALRVLTAENIQEYWRRLLSNYAARQKFRPAKHVDAVPLHISLKHPVHVPPEGRSCSICPHPSWQNYNHSFCRGVNDP